MNEPTRRHIDKARWPRLSPLLDELLDLEPLQRPARLAELEAKDSDLAADLRELLWRQDAMDAANYLAKPALQTMEAQPLNPANHAGQRLGAYALEREIGQGGMGTVWLARRTDGRFHGLVAVKFLNVALLGRGGAGRFAREGQILARLAHPHIARLLDAGISDSGEQPYLVLEYVDGLPLDQYCDDKALKPRERVALFQDVLAAVAHAHTRLILHRDLKPSNILVTSTGEVKLLDFGIAKLLREDEGENGSTGDAAATELTRQAGRAFTPRFAAPEQVQGFDVSTATDVYALGVLLYLLLSGRHPTTPGEEERTTPLERLRTLVEVAPKKLSDQVPNKSQARELRGDLDTIVAKALKKLPAERYTNAAELAEDLRRWLSDEPIAARPDSRAYVLSKFIRRHRVAVWAGSLGVLALAALTTLSVTQAWRAERAEKLALQRSAEADELLGYMLGEFADKLRPLGRMALLNDVGAKALAHLKLSNAAAGSAATNTNTILQRAKALTVLGEVSVNKRELDAAIEPLLAARQLLAGPNPEPILANDWRKAQGTAAFWLGHVYFTMRQFAPAKLAWEDYRLGSQAWLKDAPGQFEPLRELANSLSNLGVLSLERGDVGSAAEQFQNSLALKQQALTLMPQDLSLVADIAEGLSWLGSALATQGDFVAARRSFEAGLDHIYKARTMAPHDLDWIEREANMRQHLGRVLLRLKGGKLAIAILQQALNQYQDLLQTEPANRTWRQALIRTKLTLAAASPASAEASLAKNSVAQLATMEQGTGASTRMRRLPLRTEASLALAKDLQAQAQADAAQDLLTSLLPTLNQALSKQPEDLRMHIANAKLRLGLAELAIQRRDEAAARVQCVTLIKELQGQRRLLQLHYEITEVWVQAHSCLGQTPAVQAQQDWLRSKLGA